MLPQCDPTSAFISSRGGRVHVVLIHQVKSVGWTPGHLLQRLTEAMSLTCSFWTMLEWAFGGMFIHQNASDNDDVNSCKSSSIRAGQQSDVGGRRVARQVIRALAVSALNLDAAHHWSLRNTSCIQSKCIQSTCIQNHILYESKTRT